MLWDVAGALVEWRLDSTATVLLLSRLHEAGIEINRNALTFYQMAYAAFRLGVMSLGASQSDAAEQLRLQRAAAHYRAALELLISTREAARLSSLP